MCACAERLQRDRIADLDRGLDDLGRRHRLAGGHLDAEVDKSSLGRRLVDQSSVRRLGHCSVRVHRIVTPTNAAACSAARPSLRPSSGVSPRADDVSAHRAR